jgi:hypothetical protein
MQIYGDARGREALQLFALRYAGVPSSASQREPRPRGGAADGRLAGLLQLALPAGRQAAG